MTVEQARAQMVGQQVRAWEVLDPRVLDVLGSLPRERFVPSGYRELAFADTAIPLANGQFMMPPKLEGRVLQALQLVPLDRVLEIGTGSGFLTACLARLAESVVSVDIDADLSAAAGKRLAELEVHNVELRVGDALTAEFPGQFDAIAVTGSVPELPGRWTDLLNPGGRLFVVVGRAPVMEALLITRHASDALSREVLFETVVPALINTNQREPFEF
jgi:protein-L-isoaspartate(D-aspartate) O-methyltransferase